MPAEASAAVLGRRFGLRRRSGILNCRPPRIFRQIHFFANGGDAMLYYLYNADQKAASFTYDKGLITDYAVIEKKAAPHADSGSNGRWFCPVASGAGH